MEIGVHDVATAVGRARKGHMDNARRRRRPHHRIEPYSWLATGAVGVGIAAALMGAGVAQAEDATGGSSSSSTSQSSDGASSTNGGGDGSSAAGASGSSSASDSSASDPAAGSDDAAAGSDEGTGDESDSDGASADDDTAAEGEAAGDDETAGDDATVGDVEATDSDAEATDAGEQTASAEVDVASIDDETVAESGGRGASAGAEDAQSAMIDDGQVDDSTDELAPVLTDDADESTAESSGVNETDEDAATTDSAAVATVAVAVSLEYQSGDAESSGADSTDSVVEEQIAAVATATDSAATTTASMSLGDLIVALFLGLQRSLFNQSPTAKPEQDDGQTSEGVVTGDVGAADPDGDPVTVELSIGPSNGTVVVNADGTYTYTPSASLAASGGTDTFTVVVRETNASEHTHGFQGWFSATVQLLTLGAVVPNDGSYITQVVTVTIAATTDVSVEVVEQQRGFAMPTWQVDGYDGADLEESLKEIIALGATSVEFVVTWYQDTLTSSEISRTDNTVSDEGLERAITLAHELGLQVFLKPHVDLPDPATQPRSLIDPDDPDAWYASYTSFITYYAEMAQRLGVEEFSIGCELDSLTSDRARWLEVIASVREAYDGLITYAAGWDWNTASFLDQLDILGVDAYVALSSVPTTDVETLEEGWQWVVDALEALSVQYGKQILFTEAGYTSQLGTTTNPASWQISTTVSEEEQAAAYEALLATFSDESWWAGVYWWVWGNPPNSTPEALDFSPEGKLAEDVIREWWGDSASAV